MAPGTGDTASTGRSMRRDVNMEERRHFVRAHVSPGMVRFLDGQQPGRPMLGGPARREGRDMRKERTGVTGHGREDAPTPADLTRLAAAGADKRGQSFEAEAGIQRLLDAWGQATLAEREAFLWLAAEEIQAAQEGEYQNALTTPQARGNGPSFRLTHDRPERERTYGDLSSADHAAAGEEACAWLDEETEQAWLWRDDAVAAQAQGIPWPLERLKRSLAPPDKGEGRSVETAVAQGNSGPHT